MAKVILTTQFQKARRKFTKKSELREDKIERTLLLFMDNPRHPSLHLEKLAHNQICSIRLDRGNRLFFFWSKLPDTAIFFFVGPHDSYRTIELPN